MISECVLSDLDYSLYDITLCSLWPWPLAMRYHCQFSLTYTTRYVISLCPLSLSDLDYSLCDITVSSFSDLDYSLYDITVCPVWQRLLTIRYHRVSYLTSTTWYMISLCVLYDLDQATYHTVSRWSHKNPGIQSSWLFRVWMASGQRPSAVCQTSATAPSGH